MRIKTLLSVPAHMDAAAGACKVCAGCVDPTQRNATPESCRCKQGRMRVLIQAGCREEGDRVLEKLWIQQLAPVVSRS
jgi:hypothetical protein